MKSVRTRSGGALALLFCAAAVQAGPILFVDDSAPAGGDGAAWETAYSTLQAALDAARMPGSGVVEIRVGQGLYKPDLGPGRTPGDRTLSFQLVSGVALRGGYAGFGAGDPNNRAPGTFVTTLSGDLLGNDQPGFVNRADNSYSVVTGSALAAGSVLDGFQVRAGSADAPFPNSEGGGLDLRASTLSLISCVFTDSIAIYGGGVYAQNSTLTVVSGQFTGNFAYFFGGGALADGGTLRVRFSTFTGNESLSSGGGLNTVNSTAVVHTSTFRSNRAFNGGGALAFGGTLTCVNVKFLGNIADGTGGGGAAQGAGSEWHGCVFSGNFAAGDGGGLHIPGGNVRNSTLSLNISSGQGGGVFGNTTIVDNSILWGNSDMRGMIAASQIESGLSPAQVNYCIVQGNDDRPPYIGDHNLGSNPLFMNAAGLDDTPGTADDDLRLGAGSPGVDSASNTRLPMDVADVDADLDVSETLPLDIAGEARRNDDPGAPNTGEGTVPIVDRGAFERIGVPPPPCPADLSGDGLVNSVDLSQLLGAWGPGNGPADLSGDGLVNSVDLSQMLGAWGPCPAL